MSPKVWLITGASSGFGKAVTEAVLAHGGIVVATLRTPSDLDNLVSSPPFAYPQENLLVLKCDVTISSDVTSVFDKAVERYGRCDVVFNGAGFAMSIEVENTDQDKEAREMFEVNFWGSVNVIRAAMKTFREKNPQGEGGRLLTVSSGAGLFGNPTLGFYAASKHAIEGLVESLAKEIDPAWNIKISLLAPGAFKTSAQARITKYTPPEAYSDPKMPGHFIRQAMRTMDFVKGDPILAAGKILEFAELPSPPLRWVMGQDCIDMAKIKLKSVTEEVELYSSWSDNLNLK